LDFWHWIADYYLCTEGDVFKAALPSGLKVESETIVELNESYQPADDSLSEAERKILGLLGDVKHISIKELQKQLGEKKSILPLIRPLIENEAIIISESLKDNYRPKLEIRIRLKDEMDEDRLQKLFVLMKQAPKQVALLMKYVELSGILKKQEPRPVSKHELLEAAEVQPAALKALIDKNIFETYTEDIGRLDTSAQAVSPYKELNAFQQNA
jgi:primosomal protein N' (replication factor Y)